MSLLACVTGGVALWQIRRDTGLHGRWLAWSAIVVGAACAVTMSWLIWINGLAVLVRGPLPPMRAILSGSPDEVRAQWHGPAATLDAGTLAAFAAELRTRHGELLDATPSLGRNLPLKLKPRQSIVTVPITLVFDRGAVEADLGLELVDERSGATVMRWRSLRVIGSQGDDLVFPPGEPPPPPLEPAQRLPAAATPGQPSPAAAPPLP
jgi:hypothetical protein